MEFLELGTGMIFEMMDDFVNFIMRFLIIFGFIGLLFGIGIVILLHRHHLLKRQNKIPKIIVWFYYFYIPFVFTFTGSLSGSLISAESFSKKHVKDKILFVTKWTFYPYQSYVKANWEKIVTNKISFQQTLDDFFSTLKYISPTNKLWDKQRTYIANKFVPASIKVGIYTLVTTPKSYLITDPTKEEKEVNTSSRLLETVINSNIFEYDDSFWEAVGEEIKAKQKSMFSTFYLYLFFSFIFFISFPTLEIFYWYRKNKTIL